MEWEPAQGLYLGGFAFPSARTESPVRNMQLRLPKDLVGFVSWMRWVIPLAVALLGGFYFLFEQLVLQGHPPASPHVVRTLLFLFLVGPTLSWLLLTWTLHRAQSETNVQRELAARSAIGEVTAQSLDLQTVLHTALEKIIEFTGSPRGEVRLIEEDQLVLKTSAGVSENKCGQKGVPVGDCVCGKCAQQGNAVLLDDLSADPALSSVPCAQSGFRSLIAVPMSTKGRVLGVILLASPKPNAIRSRDQQVLTAIGSRVAMAVENAQLYKHAHRRAIHLEMASLMGQRMTAVLELEPLLTEVVTIIRQKFGYYHTNVLLVDEEAGELVLKQASGAGAEALLARGLRLKIGKQGITGRVAHTGQALLCNDVSREPRYFAAEPAPETKAELAVPLRVGNRVIGVLDVQSNRTDEFEKEDLTILQILGNQLGIAIENARLFQETRRRYVAMVALHDTSLDVIARLDTPKLLQALLRRGAELIGAQGGVLFLCEPAEKLLRVVANYNTWRDFTNMTLPLGGGAVGKVVLTGEPMIVDDYENWSEKAAAFAGTPHNRVVSVPLKWENQIIGGLNIVNDSQGRRFNKDDIWLLTQFADLASIAIKNAELHTQVKEFGQQLEDKVEERTAELSVAKEEIALRSLQLARLLAKTIDMQEAERARIARDMHDSVVQLITAARFELQTAKAVVGRDGTASAEDKLSTAQQVLDEMEKEIRRAIYDLHPPILDAVGLAPALQRYMVNFQRLSGIACELSVSGTPYRLPSATEIAVFRMAEEALQNIAAHANANSARVEIDYAFDNLCVSVQDNGAGFDYAGWMQGHGGTHLGLLGMRERIQNIGGTLQVWSEPGQGTRLTFQLPIVQGEEYP